MSKLTPFASKSIIVGPSGGGGGGSSGDGTLIFADMFDLGASCGFDPGYWTNIDVDTYYRPEYYTPNTAELPFDVPAVPPPSGSSCAMHYYYKVGESDTTSIQVFKSGLISETFLRWREFYKSPFIWPSAQKQFRIGNASGPGPQIIQAIGTASDGSQNIGILGSEGATVFFGGASNTNISTFALDTWHKFEVYYRKSSGPGIADAQVAMRINDVWIVNFENVVTNEGVLPVNYFWIGGNNTWNGSGPGGYTAIPAAQHRYIDKVEVYTGIPPGVPLP